VERWRRRDVDVEVEVKIEVEVEVEVVMCCVDCHWCIRRVVDAKTEADVAVHTCACVWRYNSDAGD
jgi:hypothetical protein